MKKVLIISYYWPPCGGIGVLRCLKIAKYLRQFGWEPIIFTADNADYPSIDKTNYKDIHPETIILRQKIWEPYKIYRTITGKDKNANVNNVFYTKEEKAGLAHKLSVWIRSNFFIPDARCFWINPSVKYLTNYLEKNPVDAIFSNGPPHSNTRIATIIKQKTGIPWLADFQDPWTQIDYFSLLSLTNSGLKKHQKLEQEAFAAADKTTIVSPTWKEELESIGAKNVSVIPWGYDPDDYAHLIHNPSDKFVISHLGILGYDRNPDTLFKVVSQLIDTNPEFKQRVKIALAGQVDYSVSEVIRSYDLENYVEMPGNIDRQSALQAMKDSSLLLLLLNKQSNAKGRIPGKLFEYLAVKRPILCMGDIDGDSADIVKKSKSGYVSSYTDEKEISNCILLEFSNFLSGKNQENIDSDIKEYSIVSITNSVATYLDEIRSNRKQTII